MKLTTISLLFIFTITSATYSQSQCDCWLERDSTWSIAKFDGSGSSGGPGLPPEYRNDDWSTQSILLPFTFCFYGDTVHSVFINNNGNLTIDTVFSAYSLNTFPSQLYSLITPFWADVDTRGAQSGLVYIKILSNYMAIQWDGVGYYPMHDDKLNTFQLIVSDGGVSPLPENKNIGFCYKSMQWTSGDASNGTNGFYGTPATVGINYGDGINFLQIGLYDDSTLIYDGPFGMNDGIQTLSNQSFAFDVCVNNFNVPPVLIGQYFCDTIHLCVRDTFVYNASFLAPELGQLTTVTINDHGMSGVNLITTPDYQANLSVSFIAANAGVYMVDVIGTDNGSSTAHTTYPLIFDIQNCGIGISEINDRSFVSPNPFKDELKYSFDEKQNIRITDISGKIILNSVNVESGIINTSQWRNGIYFMALTSQTKTRVIKILKN